MLTAAKKGLEPVAQALLQKRASPETNHHDQHACRPLHYACAGGHVAVVKLLCSAGADIHIKYNGLTPLGTGIACVAGHESVVAQLMLSSKGRATASVGGRVRAVNLFPEGESTYGQYVRSGCDGTVLAWDFGFNRWKVRLDDGSVELIWPENLFFIDGEAVHETSALVTQKCMNASGLALQTALHRQLAKQSEPEDLSFANVEAGDTVRVENDGMWMVSKADGTHKRFKPQKAGHLESQCTRNWNLNVLEKGLNVHSSLGAVLSLGAWKK